MTGQRKRRGARDGTTLGMRRRPAGDSREKGGRRIYSKAEANAADPADFATNPVFEHKPAFMFRKHISRDHRNEILAKGIPALSEATARHVITKLDNFIDNNIDLNTSMKNGWGRNHPKYGERWLHSDIKDMAYLYVYKAFDKMVEKGDLK